MSWNPPPERVVLDITMPVPQSFRLDPATTALVIVDMENCLVHSNDFPSAAGFSSSGGDRMASTIDGNVRLLGKARSSGARVIYIQSVRKADNLEVVRFGEKPKLLEGSPGVEIAAEIAPLPGEPVVQKWSHDPWARTSLESVLEELGIVSESWTVLVTGVSAAHCCHVCALGFSNRHYMTLIPVDCTAAPSVDDEARVDAQYLGLGYSHNIAFTHSELVTFEADAPPAEKQLRRVAV